MRHALDGVVDTVASEGVKKNNQFVLKNCTHALRQGFSDSQNSENGFGDETVGGRALDFPKSKSGLDTVRADLT